MQFGFRFAVLAVLLQGILAFAGEVPQGPVSATPAQPSPQAEKAALPTTRSGPSSLELIVPDGAEVLVDNREAGNNRTFQYTPTPGQLQRVQVVVNFSTGEREQRIVFLEAGMNLRMAINRPAADKVTAVVTQAQSVLFSAAFSPDGRYIATGADNRSIVLWDLAIGKTVRSFSGHNEAIRSVAFSPDGKYLLSGSSDWTAILWDVATGEQVRTFRGHSSGINAAAFSSNGKFIVTGSIDKEAILWDATTGDQIRSFKGHTDEILGIAISPNSKRIATGSADKSAVIWDLETAKALFMLRHSDTVGGVAFSHDNDYLATACFSNNVLFYEVGTGTRLSQTRAVNLDLNGVIFSKDDRFTFSSGRDPLGGAKMWDSVTAQLIREFGGHNSDVNSVSLSPDSRLLLTSSHDGSCRLWDIYSGAELACIVSAENGRAWAVVGPDGLFDASEEGRKMVGQGFASKLPGATIDQFFKEMYFPGLLAKLWRGERPMAKTQLGRAKPPVVKIVSPKERTSAKQQVEVTVEATDTGGGVSSIMLFQNGARLSEAEEPVKEGEVTRQVFKASLVRGQNEFRALAANGDGSWDSASSEQGIAFQNAPDRKPRMYVLEVGVSAYDDAALRGPKPGTGAADARAISRLLQDHPGKLFDRVDIVGLVDREATADSICDTLADLGRLTEPQDALVVILCGRGGRIGDQLYFAPADLRLPDGAPEKAYSTLRDQGLPLEDITALLSGARALNRALIVDAAPGGALWSGPQQRDPQEFVLRAVTERTARSFGIIALVSTAPSGLSAELIDADANPEKYGLLTHALLSSLKPDESSNSRPTEPTAAGNIDAADWFKTAAGRAQRLLAKVHLGEEVQSTTQSHGFEIMAAGEN